MSVVATSTDHRNSDPIFLGIWPDELTFWEWFEADNSDLKLTCSGKENDASFMGSDRTFVTNWSKFKDSFNNEVLVQIFIVTD